VLKRALLWLLVGVFCGVAAAQNEPAEAPEAPEPAKPPFLTIAAGYSYQNSRFLSGDRSNLQGFEASVEGFHFHPHLALVATGAGHYGWNQFPISCVTVGVVCSPNPPNSRVIQYDFMGGPQYRFANYTARWQPFVHLMGGYGRATMRTPGFFAGSWAWELAAGGGADYAWRGPWSIRVQGDYLRNNFFSTGQNNFRTGFGLVYHF
jgi:hypothetical protein